MLSVPRAINHLHQRTQPVLAYLHITRQRKARRATTLFLYGLHEYLSFHIELPIEAHQQLFLRSISWFSSGDTSLSPTSVAAAQMRYVRVQPNLLSNTASTRPIFPANRSSAASHKPGNTWLRIPHPHQLTIVRPPQAFLYNPRPGLQSAKPSASVSRKLAIAISMTASIG